MSKHSIYKFFIFISFFTNLIIYSHIADVSIFLEDDEQTDIQKGAVQSGALLNLCQKASPVIMSGHTANIISQLIAQNDPNIRSINFDTEFDIYRNNSNSIYLFIPKTYINNQTTSYLTPEFIKKVHDEGSIYSPQDLLLGFNIAQLTKINKNQLANANRGKITSSTAIQNMFLIGKSDIFPLWNIYLIGHGWYSATVTKNISFQSLEQEVNNSQLTIVSLPLNEFRGLLQFFTNKISVNLFYYITCHGGDVNLILPFVSGLINTRGRITGLNKPNFTVVSGALTSEIVYYSSNDSLETCVGLKLTSYYPFINFSEFFYKLRQYTSKSRNIRTIYNDKQLSEILNSITPRANWANDISGISALPSVMFPNTDTFRVIPLSDKFGILSNVALQKSILEKSPITFKNKEVILIYAPDINKLIIQNSANVIPAIVSMIPGRSITKINSLETNLSFANLIKGLKTTNPVYTKYFFIKELKTSDNTFNNVLIEITKDEFPYTFFYTQTNNVYAGSQTNTYLFADEVYNITENSFLNSIINYFNIGSNKNTAKKQFDYKNLKEALIKDESDLLNSKEIKNSIINADKIAMKKARAPIVQNQFNNMIKRLQSLLPKINQFKQAQNNKNQARINQLRPQINRIQQQLKNMQLNRRNNQGKTFLMTNPGLTRILLVLPKPRAQRLANLKDNNGKDALWYLIQHPALYDKQRLYMPLIVSNAKITPAHIQALQQKANQKKNKNAQAIVRLLRNKKK